MGFHDSQKSTTNVLVAALSLDDVEGRPVTSSVSCCVSATLLMASCTCFIREWSRSRSPIDPSLDGDSKRGEDMVPLH